MKKTIALLLTFYIAALCIPQQASAQAYTAPAGDNFRQEGIASWYGAEFDGRPTASGEVFNSSMFTAAHPSLPFGTYLLVTNRHNNKQVAVRVNDRGPFVASRIIDVSRAAAEQLDMLATGTAPVLIETINAGQQQAEAPIQYLPPVQVQPMAQPQQPVVPQTPVPQQPVYPQQTYIPPAPVQPQQITIVPAPAEIPPVTVTVYPPPAPPVPPPAPAPAPVIPAPIPENLPPALTGARLIPSITPQPNKTYRLQVGSYKVPGNAVEAYTKLKAVGLNPEYERNGDFFRVVIKGIRGSEVQSVANTLGTTGFSEAVIREE
ncbi:MAG: septal ring lytic transglycosylase RlpA family protein [Treponema sp.]|nr:septal ring lytic transglycosylase RlpA family protein [Treponema sp.]